MQAPGGGIRFLNQEIVDIDSITGIHSQLPNLFVVNLLRCWFSDNLQRTNYGDRIVLGSHVFLDRLPQKSRQTRAQIAIENGRV